jgi:hypothetical protein
MHWGWLGLGTVVLLVSLAMSWAFFMQFDQPAISSNGPDLRIAIAELWFTTLIAGLCLARGFGAPAPSSVPKRPADSPEGSSTP